MWQAREAHTRSPAHDDMVFQEGAFQHHILSRAAPIAFNENDCLL